MKRPSRTDEYVLKAAASACAESIVKHHHAYHDEPQDELIADLIQAFRRNSHDGYEIAKELERSGWDPDAELVELLNNWYVDDAIREMTRQWVIAENIRPMLPVGTHVRIGVGWEGRFAGTILRIEETQAQYIVNVPGKTSDNGGYVKNYEDVELAPADDAVDPDAGAGTD